MFSDLVGFRSASILDNTKFDSLWQYVSTERLNTFLQIFQGRSKVAEWLKVHPDLRVEHREADSSLTLLETIKVNHISARTSSIGLKFSLSEFSDSVGIASTKAKPSLSVMYPGTDENPLILSRKDRYTSALFITMSNHEYLAAATRDEIRLWNVEKNTSSVAYTFPKGKDWHLCVIDDRTVACIPAHTSSEDFNKIYILNTDTEKFTLSGTLRVKVGDIIFDMCFVKTTDATACLILIFNQAIRCVEIVGGKIRWQVGKQQMNGSIYPWGNCTDGSTVFVTDPFQHQLHLLSVDEGSILTSINLHPFGLVLPSCVRLHRDHLYVGHLNKNVHTYCISKFAKSSVQDSD